MSSLFAGRGAPQSRQVCRGRCWLRNHEPGALLCMKWLRNNSEFRASEAEDHLNSSRSGLALALRGDPLVVIFNCLENYSLLLSNCLRAVAHSGAPLVSWMSLKICSLISGLRLLCSSIRSKANIKSGLQRAPAA